MKFSKKNWLTNLVRDLSPTSNSASKGFVSTEASKSGPMEHIPNVLKVLGIFFAAVGAMGSFKWFVSVMATLDHTFLSQSVQQTQPEVSRDSLPETSSSEDCSTDHVMTEFTSRLQLLEVAFKEQVFARESIAREITDQSDVYGSLEHKLTVFIEKLNNISAEFAALENRYKHLSDRVHSDEIIGLMVIIVIALGFILWCRPFLERLFENVEEYRPNFAKLLFFRRAMSERKSTSNPGTPKHMRHLRNEICIIFTQRDCANSIFSNLYEAMVRHLEGIKLATKPYFTVYTNDDLRSMPHVKLYVIIVDLETRGTYINGSEKDMIILTAKYTKSIGAQTMVVITNDEGSKNLTAHSMYNSSIRMIKTNDCLHELAANGRLFSMWKEMTSHQLSHLRRVIKTVLNVKSVMR